MSQAGLTKISSAILPGNVLTKVNVQTGVSPVVPSAQTITFNGAVVAAGTHPVRTDGTGASTMALEVQTSQAIAATDATKIGLSAFNSAQFTVDANGFVSVLGGASYISLSPYIVGPDAHSGFATIAAAIAQAVADGASASNPKNIYIKPQNGGYTENLTLSDGINLIGFGTTNGSLGMSVTTTNIIGKITMTSAGNATINNLTLSTNADYVLEVTGANVIEIAINDCLINVTNSNAIHCTNANAYLHFVNCQGKLFGANTFFVFTAGAVDVDHCDLDTNNSTTPSTFANANCNMSHTFMACPITTSGTGSVGLYSCQILVANATCLTHGGSGNSIVMESRFESGTASAVSIGATLSMIHCSVFSSNANAITGAGTLFYGMIVFYGSGASSGVNTGTVTALATLI